ncbi:UNVERIFIED_CONTAM: protein FIP1 [Sesamum latifolium]|uniref:Protein FIP1 n=1 Tax=Sesamum latifolium TaxID=2727402 RepID=A0AAW2U3W2_9LAMI
MQGSCSILLAVESAVRTNRNQRITSENKFSDMHLCNANILSKKSKVSRSFSLVFGVSWLLWFQPKVEASNSPTICYYCICMLRRNERLRAILGEWSTTAAKLERALEAERISNLELQKKITMLKSQTTQEQVDPTLQLDQ